MKEVESQLDISVELGYINKEQFDIVAEMMNSVGRQLSVLRSKYMQKQ